MNIRSWHIENLFNILLILGVIAVTLLAFFFQLYIKELPCPLCLFQRIGFLCISIGALLNLRFGFYPSHYSLILTSALLTSFIALRQVALHILPGTGSYGMSVLGLHLYTWSFIFAVIILVFTSIVLGINRQYKLQAEPIKGNFINILFMAVLSLALANVISVILECGLQACPDNPTFYKLLWPG